MTTHSGDVLMPWEHIVCTICFQENPYAVWLIKQQCFKPKLHQRDLKLARVVVSEKSAVLEEIRPKPQKSISGRFIRCYYLQCSDEQCTYAHSIAEQVTWNIKLELLKSKTAICSSLFT